MPKYFPGITHCIVHMPKDSQEITATGGVICNVSLYFGNDSDGLGPIRIKKMAGVVSGVTAHAPKAMAIVDGKKVWIHVLNGKVADEAKLLALIAFDSVKQRFGIKYNKKYRVTGNIIEEIGVTDVVSCAGVGEQPTT